MGNADGVKTALYYTPQIVQFSMIQWTLSECRRLEESFFLQSTQQSYSNLQCNSIIEREQVTDRMRSSLIKLWHRNGHAVSSLLRILFIQKQTWPTLESFTDHLKSLWYKIIATMDLFIMVLKHTPGEHLQSLLLPLRCTSGWMR